MISICISRSSRFSSDIRGLVPSPEDAFVFAVFWVVVRECSVFPATALWPKDVSGFAAPVCDCWTA
ncbi:hypothetical protein AB0D59_24165 [Streptomyces sp. NPDC048417]|uniref:hypothetical protein n=1 Tax=Streptomyces sp. NPDC048417 TaxID=3155387 RepID=UPI0034132D7E